MRLLAEDAEVAPSTFFATLLNAPCSSLLLSSATEQSTVYLVVGKSNGETVFFPADRSEGISKYGCELSVPITALAAGDLRNIGRREVITVTANGVLQSLNYPMVGGESPACPTLAFAQQIYANVCHADVLDVDGDGRAEFLVAMTDRVVRSYRYARNVDQLVPLMKWETPAHISAYSIGLAKTATCIYLSQSERNQFVRIEFVGDAARNDAQRAIQLRALCAAAGHSAPDESGDALAEKEWKHESAGGGEEKVEKEYNRAALVVAARPYATQMFHALLEQIFIIDSETGAETQLEYKGVGVSCVTTVTLPSGLILLVTVDPYGLMLIYGWMEGEMLWRAPIARCRVARSVHYICAFAGGVHNFALIVGTVNVYNKIAMFSIDLSHIVTNTIE